MSSVGLFYVGAVLYLNALMLLGKVEERAASPLNLFVGFLQVITPLYLIFNAKGDPWAIFSASGLFLFGFTYLYVGIGNLTGMDSSGVGWYSSFVAIVALGYSAGNFLHFHDYTFGVIWIMWSFLWFLFWVLLGIKREISTYTGWVTMYEAWITCVIRAFLMLTSQWSKFDNGITALAVAILDVLVFAGLYRYARPAPRQREAPGTRTLAGEA